MGLFSFLPTHRTDSMVKQIGKWLCIVPVVGVLAAVRPAEVRFARDAAPAVPAASAPLVLGEALSAEMREAGTEVHPALVPAIVDDVLVRPDLQLGVAAAEIDRETLWLARVIFSETKQPHEQELIAWVVRNRVETAYRGQTSYEGVVRDPYQFSAFNPASPVRAFYSTLGPKSRVPGWQTALAIASHVRHAAAWHRPFPLATRHFYSERSMVGASHPEWASGKRPVAIESAHVVDARRFRFFKGIS